MSTLVTPGEEILYIADDPTMRRQGRSYWRLVRWVAAGLFALVITAGIFLAVRIEVLKSRQDLCAGRLKSLGLAMHQYHEANGHFPAPALAGRDGTPLLSWRVALLPQMGYGSLYERFHLDEPWDSPHNRALITEMPAEFACPGGPGRHTGGTGYLVIVGPATEPSSVNTPFEPTRGVDLREITDGTSSTILVIETNTRVRWTKPEDLRWAPDGPLPALASPHTGGAHALFGDGSTRFLKNTIAQETLKSIVTANGAEAGGG